MFFRSFAAYSHVFALILASLLLLSLPDAASGAQQQNVTVRFNSTRVSFTSGWRVAEFTETGRLDKFAFANNPGEQLIVKLPRNVTRLSYRGFKIRGGAQYLVCLDCDEDATLNSFTVDAHDESDNGTQPPVTLFQVKEVDPKRTHVLRVINLEDDRFNDTSQITFDSLVLTLIDEDTVSPSRPVGSPTLTTSPGTTSTTPDGSNLTTTVIVSLTGGSSGAPSGTSTSKPPTLSVSASHSITSGVATISTSSSNPQGPTATVGSGGGSVGQSQPSSTPGATLNGSQPQTVSGTVGGVTGSGGSQPTTAAASSPGSGSSSGTSSGQNPSSSSTLDQGIQPSNGDVSKTVIIVVAVIASLFVLALLAAITWLLVRNQPSPRGDVEGTPGLMRQAAPAAVTVSGPLPLSPMRPEIPNPFVDPLDDLIQSLPPRPAPPPPVPPRSPLRTTNFSGDRPAWLTRTPRTPSPEVSSE